jgi:hypothetical protein
MDRVRIAGGLLVGAALAGYVVGVLAPYPGRALTAPGIMVGLTLLALGEAS